MWGVMMKICLCNEHTVTGIVVILIPSIVPLAIETCGEHVLRPSHSSYRNYFWVLTQQKHHSYEHNRCLKAPSIMLTQYAEYLCNTTNAC